MALAQAAIRSVRQEKEGWKVALSTLPTVLEAQRAASRSRVDPIPLYQEILPAKVHVRRRAVAARVRRAERPGALVGVLLAPPVVPGVEVLVRRGFLGFVRQGVHLGVRERIVVRRSVQGGAGGGEVVIMRHHGVLHVVPVPGEMPMVGAVLRTEATAEVDARVAEDGIERVAVERQLAAGETRNDLRLHRRIRYARA